MKKILLSIACALAFLSSCVSGNNYKHGDIVSTNTECLSASSNEDFNELNRVSNRMDEDALKQMIAWGRVYVLPSNTRIKVDELGFGKIEGKVQSGVYEGIYVVVSSEFVSK